MTTISPCCRYRRTCRAPHAGWSSPPLLPTLTPSIPHLPRLPPPPTCPPLFRLNLSSSQIAVSSYITTSLCISIPPPKNTPRTPFLDPLLAPLPLFLSLSLCVSSSLISFQAVSHFLKHIREDLFHCQPVISPSSISLAAPLSPPSRRRFLLPPLPPCHPHPPPSLLPRYPRPQALSPCPRIATRPIRAGNAMPDEWGQAGGGGCNACSIIHPPSSKDSEVACRRPSRTHSAASRPPSKHASVSAGASSRDTGRGEPLSLQRRRWPLRRFPIGGRRKEKKKKRGVVRDPTHPAIHYPVTGSR